MEKWGDAGLVVISVHSPEFEFEKDRGRIERFARKFKMTNPIFVDNDFAYWKALYNEYWPEFYLVDRKGQIRAKVQGEIHAKTERAKSFRSVLLKLLAE